MVVARFRSFRWLGALLGSLLLRLPAVAAPPPTPPPADSLTLRLGQDSTLFAVIVADAGRPRYRHFFHGRRAGQAANVQSVGKSVMALLVGIALDRHALRSLDQPLSDFFPALLTAPDTLKRRLTIRHLLDQTSGLPTMEYPRLDEWLALPDPTHWLLGQPLVSAPGAVYAYNSAATHLLSAVLTQAGGVPVEVFAQRYLFGPLGIRAPRWDKRGDGYADGAGLGLWLRPDDLTRLGQLLLTEGQWRGRAVVSAGWCRALADPAAKRPTAWGLRDSRHGLAWYAATYRGEAVTYAMGYGGQYILLLPASRRVIVAQHAYDTPRGIKQSIYFLRNLLPALVAYARQP